MILRTSAIAASSMPVPSLADVSYHPIKPYRERERDRESDIEKEKEKEKERERERERGTKNMCEVSKIIKLKRKERGKKEEAFIEHV